MDISIIVPLYNEAESLPSLYEWIVRVMNEHKFTYEIIFVNDGSTDNSWQVIKQMSVESRKSKVESQESIVESQKSKVESQKSKVESQESKVEGAKDAMYYAFYTDDQPFSGTIELRGLEEGKTYTAVEYAADEPREFTVDGSNPKIEVDFERSYLLKLVEQ